MHELGHTLGLLHGGGDDMTQKPNYLSVMNYPFQPCTVPTSPPGSRTPIPGGCDYSRWDVDLNEASLDECFGLGPALGFGPEDWNKNGLLEGATCPPPYTGNVTEDISFLDGITELDGFDDWGNLVFAFQGLPNFGDDGPIDPVPDEPDPETIADAQRSLGELLAPQIVVAVSGPATALPGETLTYTVETANHGRGPAFAVAVTVARPDGSTTTFGLGDLIVGAATTREVQVTVPEDACPETLAVGATAAFTDVVGAPGSASGAASSEVLDTAVPVLRVTLSPSRLWPSNHQLRTINATVTATDACDPSPQVQLVSVTSSEPDDGRGDGDMPGDISGAEIGTDDRSFRLRAERSGLGPGRVYTVVYETKDASGNIARATSTVIVPRTRTGFAFRSGPRAATTSEWSQRDSNP